MQHRCKVLSLDQTRIRQTLLCNYCLSLRVSFGFLGTQTGFAYLRNDRSDVDRVLEADRNVVTQSNCRNYVFHSKTYMRCSLALKPLNKEGLRESASIKYEKSKSRQLPSLLSLLFDSTRKHLNNDAGKRLSIGFKDQ